MNPQDRSKPTHTHDVIVVFVGQVFGRAAEILPKNNFAERHVGAAHRVKARRRQQVLRSPRTRGMITSLRGLGIIGRAIRAGIVDETRDNGRDVSRRIKAR
jgi:hypothetical protein